MILFEFIKQKDFNIINYREKRQYYFTDLWKRNDFEENVLYGYLQLEKLAEKIKIDKLIEQKLFNLKLKDNLWKFELYGDFIAYYYFVENCLRDIEMFIDMYFKNDHLTDEQKNMVKELDSQDLYYQQKVVEGEFAKLNKVLYEFKFSLKYMDDKWGYTDCEDIQQDPGLSSFFRKLAINNQINSNIE